MPTDFNQSIIEEFRANDGRVGGMFAGARLLLLTTTGARSGAKHTVPLGYLPDGAERTILIASAGGSPRDPAWVHNLVANPRVTIETGVFTHEAEAEVLTGAERDQLFARAVEADSGWAEYQEKANRILPVIALRHIPGPPNIANATSIGDGLRLIHDAFRHELTLIRAEIADTGGGIGAQLRVNCLTFCQGLGIHHRAEDDGVFPALADRSPDLAETLAQLRTEHESIAGLLEEIRHLISTDQPDRTAVLTEFDRLSAELDHHLRYEEKELIPVLDAAT